MKIVILRGGAMAGQAPVAMPAGKQPGLRLPVRTSPGVTALGSGDGRWVLINVSAAVAQQLAHDGALGAHAGLHNAAVQAVLLTDAHIEHVGGLIGLRGNAAIELYATPSVFEDLSTHLPVLPALQHYCDVQWHVVPVAGDHQVACFEVEGLPKLEFTAMATQSTPPAHLKRGANPAVGDSIALAVHDRSTGQRVFCAPGGACIGAVEFDWMRHADCLLLDPELLISPELQSPGRDCFELLAQLPARHKVLLAERQLACSRSAAAPGFAVAFDRMAIEL